MDSWEEELRVTVAKVQQSKELLSSRVQYRDRQLSDAITRGATWAQLQKITGLSPRGLALALARNRKVS